MSPEELGAIRRAMAEAIAIPNHRRVCPMMLSIDRDHGHFVCVGSRCAAWVVSSFPVFEQSGDARPWTPKTSGTGSCGMVKDAGRPASTFDDPAMVAVLRAQKPG